MKWVREILINFSILQYNLQVTMHEQYIVIWK